MKNLHLLPTEKPSRLYKDDNQVLTLNTHPVLKGIFTNGIGSNQHIYITSDEEIKEGDWIIWNKKIVKAIDTDYYSAKKIILTTDQDLIKDGVQTIDDTFLEWFIKNPSCENVKIEIKPMFPMYSTFIESIDNPPFYGNLKRKIIIPQEEPKIDSIFNEANVRFSETLDKLSDNSLKQETLEEAANNWIKNTSEFLSVKNGFIKGAKWQAERMGLMEIELRHTKTLLASCEKALEDRDKQADRGYSEEEVKSAFKIGFNIGYGSPVSELDLKQQHCDRWFEKHKKK
jgi:hypothetical protein